MYQIELKKESKKNNNRRQVKPFEVEIPICFIKCQPKNLKRKTKIYYIQSVAQNMIKSDEEKDVFILFYFVFFRFSY